MPTQNDIMARGFARLRDEMILERQRRLDEQLRIALHTNRLAGQGALPERLKALLEPQGRFAKLPLSLDFRRVSDFVRNLSRTYPEQFDKAVQTSAVMLSGTNLEGLMSVFMHYGAWPRGFPIVASIPPHTWSMLRSILENYRDEILPLGEAVINPDDTLTVGNYVISRDEIVSEINRTFPDPIGPDGLFVPQQINLLIEQLTVIIPKSENRFRKFWLDVLASIVAGLILMAGVEYYAHNEKLKDGAYKKALEEQVRREFNNDYLSKYRIVTAKRFLSLREGPSTKTKEIGRLICGDLVELQHKGKDWCMVTIRKGDREELTGWASTNYLSPIKR